MEAHIVIPQELVEDILSRLPVRHLLRLRCVSKSWCALIDNYRFIDKHHQVQCSMAKDEGDIPFFVDNTWKGPTQFYLLSKKKGDVPLCMTPGLRRDSARYFTDDLFSVDRLCCVGVLRGIVGFCWGVVDLGLWNPATREFKVVPSLPSNNVREVRGLFCLGLDSKSNDFKVLRSRGSISDKESGDCKIVFIYELFSLSTNSWKRLEEPLPDHSLDFPPTDGYFDGVYYWIAHERKRVYPFGFKYLILSFDFSREVFKLFDPPRAVMNMEQSWRVGQYMEQLALIFSRGYSTETVDYLEYEIWVACGFGVEDSGMSLSWQHLFTIRPTADFSAFRCMWPVTFRIDGDLLLMTIRKEGNELSEGGHVECHLYNTSTHTFKKLGVSYGCFFGYVESLFRLSKRQVRTSDRLAISGPRGRRRKRTL